MEVAIHRRLDEELGLRCQLHFLFKFQYQAPFDSNHAEHELCSVFVGRCCAAPKINQREILATRWISPEALQAELGRESRRFTPWLVLEWGFIWREHRAALFGLPRELRP